MSNADLDNLARVLRHNPEFQHARLVEARARIKELEQLVDDLLTRLSEAHGKKADA